MVAGSALRALETIEAMDAELARLSRSGGALRFGLGVGLEALAQQGGHHELGFSSLEAYALERCERSARWVQESRSLARKLAEFPAIRSALLSGQLSWSMAFVLASEATAEDEGAWLETAKGRTVREMRVLVKERRPQKEREQGDDAQQGQSAVPTEEQSTPVAEDQSPWVAEQQSILAAGHASGAGDASGANDDFCVLTVTVDREDA